MYAHLDKVIAIGFQEHERGFVRRHMGWGAIEDRLSVLFRQIVPVAMACERPGSNNDVATGGGAGSGGTIGIDVTRAAGNDFVGEFSQTDPNRTYEKYHGTVSLRADGTFLAREWHDGRELVRDGAEGTWSFDPSTLVLTLDYQSDLGRVRFAGPVTGNTRDFVIAGNWNNGTPGRLRYTR
jgi:hypothetical protein